MCACDIKAFMQPGVVGWVESHEGQRLKIPRKEMRFKLDGANE